MVPLVLWLIMVGWDSFTDRVIALVLLVLAASTDGIDGAIARKRNLVTNLGKILDPIADKALLSGALIVLSIQGAVPWWATIMILVREFGITVYRLAIARKRVIAASGGGKFKTVADAEFVPEQYGIALKKGNAELLDKVNQGLAAIKADGTYDQIFSKYFGAPPAKAAAAASAASKRLTALARLNGSLCGRWSTKRYRCRNCAGSRRNRSSR